MLVPTLVSTVALGWSAFLGPPRNRSARAFYTPAGRAFPWDLLTSPQPPRPRSHCNLPGRTVAPMPHTTS